MYFDSYRLRAFLDGEFREPQNRAVITDAYTDAGFKNERSAAHERLYPAALGRALMLRDPQLKQKLLAPLSNADPNTIFRWNDRGLPDRRRALRARELSDAVAYCIGRIIVDEMESRLRCVAFVLSV